MGPYPLLFFIIKISAFMSIKSFWLSNSFLNSDTDSSVLFWDNSRYNMVCAIIMISTALSSDHLYVSLTSDIIPMPIESIDNPMLIESLMDII